MNSIILADPSIPSPIPSDQGSPSSVAPETPVCGDTFLVIPSVQPLNSHAPEDELHDLFWNPVWEPYEEDFPSTPTGASTPMDSSDMEDTSPVAGETPLVSSIETPIPATSLVISTPYTVSPLGIIVPAHYRALRDAMGSRNSSSGTMWDHNITPTTRSLVSQVQNTVVTSVPTNPTICVASSTPVVSAVTTYSIVTTVAGLSHGPAHSGQLAHASRVVHLAVSTSPSSGAIRVGGIFSIFACCPKSRHARPLL